VGELEGRAGRASRWAPIHTVFVVWIAVLCLLAAIAPGAPGGSPEDASRDPSGLSVSAQTRPGADGRVGTSAAAPAPATLPGGRMRVFDHQMLVAYYGIPGNAALGVLGEGTPMQVWPRLRRAAAAYAGPGRRVQPVFEVVVSLAREKPGRDGDYSTDISRAVVESYIRAAHRVGALVILDIQTGRSSFLEVARRLEWALRDPWVGLAIDPERRVHGNDRPGQVIGHVDATEVNRVSAWLEDLTRRLDLPQKVFMIHQFRESMVLDPAAIRSRPDLAMVQHVDGFGTPHDKLATYHVVARPGTWPRQFHEGFKLFYRADTVLMSPAQVLRIRPRVDFVSYQ
jgi:hypothetical protein